MQFILLAASSTGTGTGGFFGSTYGMLIPIIAIFALMYFLMIRPQNKQRKAEEEMRNQTDVGDEVTTIGGIVGKVVSVKEDTLVIETGADRNKMKVKRWSIQSNDTKKAAHQKAMEEAKKAKEEAKKAAKEKKLQKNGKKTEEKAENKK